MMKISACENDWQFYLYYSPKPLTMENRNEVYKALLVVQKKHIIYSKQIQKELADCVTINNDMSISLRPHCELSQPVIEDLKKRFVYKE